MASASCHKCGATENLQPPNGNRGRCCRPCHNKYCRERYARPEQSAKHNGYAKRRRQERPVTAVLRDSRQSDRRSGLANDLTAEYVSAALVLPCVYCGTLDKRMTLDRIDNEVGHVQANCVTACMRCNYVRRDMPHAAWVVVAKGMREAVRLGLFGEWLGRGRRPGEPSKSTGVDGGLSNRVETGPIPVEGDEDDFAA